ncbi:MAG TPA: alpha-E domain-containing protein [Microthrixaceae bacterium]|nr:alpha-E domain-containing protein [Microthrixaceae bacterium]
MTARPDTADEPPTESDPEEVATMLLSRVAENIYWAGRYLERAEATARLVKTHTELYVDLPLSAGVGWAPLLVVTGSHDAYQAAYAHAREDEVVAFLVTDNSHTGSVVASIGQARSNLRATRAMLPRRTWEIVNELHHHVADTGHRAVDRRTRLSWNEDLIRRCHLVSGSINATMSRDDAFSFLEIGRMIERADMTTRVLDVQAGILMGDDGHLDPYADLTWMAVLSSVGAEQMFRRAMGGAVNGPDAVRFLLRDTSFPRSVEHCLIEVSRWLLELPHQERPMAGCAAVQRSLDAVELDALDADGLHDFVDELQVGFAELHELLTGTYFLSEELAAT